MAHRWWFRKGLNITNADSEDESGINIVDESPGSISLISDVGGVTLESGESAINLQVGTTDDADRVFLVLNPGFGGGVFQVRNTSGEQVRVNQTGIGFFGKSPVAQQAKPVTLQNVIDALTALGLVSS